MNAFFVLVEGHMDNFCWMFCMATTDWASLSSQRWQWLWVGRTDGESVNCQNPLCCASRSVAGCETPAIIRVVWTHDGTTQRVSLSLTDLLGRPSTEEHWTTWSMSPCWQWAPGDGVWTVAALTQGWQFRWLCERVIGGVLYDIIGLAVFITSTYSGTLPSCFVYLVRQRWVKDTIGVFKITCCKYTLKLKLLTRRIASHMSDNVIPWLSLDTEYISCWFDCFNYEDAELKLLNPPLDRYFEGRHPLLSLPVFGSLQFAQYPRGFTASYQRHYGSHQVQVQRKYTISN